jgi:tetratricopeptide (TPR) repeat protein
MNEEKRFDVFLSYSRADKRPVTRLAKKLKLNDIECFLDEWNLAAGDPWQEALSEALKRSRSCAVVLGPTGPGPWTQQEIQLALQIRQADKTFRLIPVLLPKAETSYIPAFLTNLNWVDFRRGLSNAESFYRLICAIRGVEADLWREFGAKDQTWLLLRDRAKAWEKSGRPEEILLKGQDLDDLIKWSLQNNRKLTPIIRAYLDSSYGLRQREAAERDERQNAEILASPTIRRLEEVHEKPNAIDLPAVHHNLTVLTRLAQRDPSTSHYLNQILEERLDQLGEVAVNVASETGDPLGLALAKMIQKNATPEILVRILGVLEHYQDSVPLREVAVEATRKYLNIQQVIWPQPNNLQKSQRAKLMESLGERLSRIGQWNEALHHAQESVAWYRQLFSEQPATFSLDLARSLNQLGERLYELGKYDEALMACREAIAIERILLSNHNG